MSAGDERAYYDRMWAEAASGAEVTPHDPLRLRVVIDAVAAFRPGRGLRIVELGCGIGWMAVALAELGHVTGVDRSEVAVAEARRRLPAGTFVAGDVTRELPLATSSFDLAVSSEVIEHVHDQAGHIGEIARLLAPGGLLVMTHPNRRAQASFFRHRDHRQPVENWLTMAESRRLCEQSFRVLDSRTFCFAFEGSWDLHFAQSRRLDAWQRRLLGRNLVREWLEASGRGLYVLTVARRK